MATVSIVLPVFNERNFIGRALTYLTGLGAEELLVVDGGSEDGTARVARAYPGITLLKTARGRALQMNAGARASSGDILLFAHADMVFPADAVERIGEVIRSGAVGGCFFKRYEPAGLLLRSYGWGLNHLLLAGMRRMVGTNGLFVRREIFLMLGGFPEVPILEDLIFADRLRLCGRLGIVRQPMVVSGRRYVKAGTFRQILVNGRILFAYDFLHRSPDRLRILYEQHSIRGGKKMRRWIGLIIVAAALLGFSGVGSYAQTPKAGKYLVILQAGKESHEGMARAVHALLYARELKEHGHEVRLVFDGAGTEWAEELNNPESDSKIKPMYNEFKEQGISEVICDFCAGAFGVKEKLQGRQLPLTAGYEGHPSIAQWADQGYRIIIL